ncbi:hypothetical protein [Formosa sp. PL04]|uniref:hypothetical protein n=1 Tax=Formosa sp. PL04 TaxID=3081755 RepID=UPI0029816759|nr:hypothetical protein [Formosa sp. PL04]MDW5290865.1 hypothetical protein [Formosa sp. PL04]
MKPSTLLGAASVILRSKRLTIVFIAIQLGYLTHRYLENKHKKEEELAQQV